jgi:FkbM family methyltransferase
MTWESELDALPHDRAGVVHVGAHSGREVEAYRRIGYGTIRLVEPLPERAAQLRKLPGVDVVEAAVSSKPGRRRFHVANGDHLSSLLRPFGLPHRVVEVDAVPLSGLLEGVSVVVVDVQGSEVDVLSSGDLWPIDVVVAESSDEPRYEGAATTATLDAFMEKVGFAPVARIRHKWVPGGFDTIFQR